MDGARLGAASHGAPEVPGPAGADPAQRWPVAAWRAVRHGADLVAPWAGLAHIWVILGLSVLLQYVKADDYGVDVGGWLQGVPPSWLAMSAASGAIAGLLAVLSGSLRWPALLFGGLFTLWMGSGALSSWALTGQVDMRSVQLGLACGGLALGAASARSAWSGWSIYLIGLLYIGLSVVALYRNYYSLGSELTVAGRWWLGEWPPVPTPGSPPPGLPFPDGVWPRVQALIQYQIDQRPLAQYDFRTSTDAVYLHRGLTAHANLGGNLLAGFVAFGPAFARGRWKAHLPAHRIAVVLGRWALALAILVPGVFLLYAMAARTAFAAVLVAVLVVVVPLGWTRNRRVATLAAVLTPAAIMLPWLLTQLNSFSFTGRMCIWDAWAASMEGSPVWGLGPPGRFGTDCSGTGSLNLRSEWHPHNEVFQAWSIGGLVGLAAAVTALVLLVWFAVRLSDRDDRALLAVMTCAVAMMGLEVLSSFFGNSVLLGIGVMGAAAGRSLQLMTGQSPAREPVSAPPGP